MKNITLKDLETITRFIEEMSAQKEKLTDDDLKLMRDLARAVNDIVEKE